MSINSQRLKTDSPQAKLSPSSKEVFIVAGEASGDEHAALAVEELRKLNPELTFFGMGGTEMRKAGVETIVDSEVSGSVMGFVEVFGKLGEILRARKQLIAEVKLRKPALAVLVDYPDFNFSLLSSLAKSDVDIVYYISPQLWAWRRRRARVLKKYVTKVLSIFPFEEDFFAGVGVSAKYVGHPFTDRPPLTGDRKTFFSQLGLDPAGKIVALLPGSRQSEIQRLLPLMKEAFVCLRKQHPNVQAVLPVASTLDFDLIADVLRGSDIVPVKGCSRQCLSFSDAAIVASGTATVEAALSKKPFVVVYKLAPLTFAIAKVLVRGVKHFAMVNLIAGKKIIPEFLQSDARAEVISEEVSRMLYDEQYKSQIISDLEEVSHKLYLDDSQQSNSSERVAVELNELLSEQMGSNDTE
jgi:lipid-A-disaccharide synthase